MPNLVHFQITTRYCDDERALSEPGASDSPTMNQAKQEARALMRLEAFVLLRHPNLDILIWPPSSIGGDSVISAITVQLIEVTSKLVKRKRARQFNLKLHFTDDPELVLVRVSISLSPAHACHISVKTSNEKQDQVLNATRLRSYAWDVLPTIDIDDFILPYDIESSEVKEEGMFYSKVDELGYLTRK